MVTAKELIAWIDETGKTGPYNYGNVSDCALAQFLKHRHPNADVIVGGREYWLDHGDRIRISVELSEALSGFDDGRDHTFEGLRARLELI